MGQTVQGWCLLRPQLGLCQVGRAYLDLDYGLVSLQFHVKYDDSFESIKQLKLSGSQWQLKCQFTSEPTGKPATTVPVTSTNEGGSSTYKGAIHTAGTGHREPPMAPLPVPLLMESLAQADNEGQEPLLPLIVGMVLNQEHMNNIMIYN